MNCQQFEDRLNDLLDERRDPADDPLLAEHARACPACRVVQLSYAKLLSAVTALGVPAPSADLVDRIQRSLDHTPQPAAAAGAGPRRSLAWFAVAASVLVLLAWAIAQRMFDPPVGGDRAPVAVAPVVPPTLTPPVETPPAPEPSAVAHAAQQTGAHLADVLLLIPGVTPPPAAPAAEGQPAATGNWLNQMASGLAPLTRSTTEALDFLLDAVPEPSGSES